MSNVINFDLFKCRCSAIHKILAESRSNPCLTEKQAARLDELEKKDTLTEKMQQEMAELLVKKENSTKVILSDTCIEYLMEYYAWATVKKKPVSKDTMYIQYVEKGKDVEEASITLLSMVEGELYYKNQDRVYNDFLSGEPDVFKGQEIMNAEKISDIKSAWDYPTYLCKIKKKPVIANDYQLKGYMDITGAPMSEIAHCLINTPERIMWDLRTSLLRRMNVISDESPEFVQAWDEIERSCYFDDIPMQQRVFKIPIQPFSDFERQQLYDKVKCCREWLWKFHEEMLSLNSNTVTYSKLQ